MESIQSANQVSLPRRLPGGMRVVVLEQDPEYTGRLRMELSDIPGFTLVGESKTWDECVTLLDTYLPEVLITMVSLPTSPEFTGEQTFPVIVALRPKNCRLSPNYAFETLDAPFDTGSLRASMERVRAEIYRRKLDELSALMRQYMNFSSSRQSYITSFEVEDGVTGDIPADEVMFLAADGNYVRIQTGAKVHEIRETMSGMTSKLDPAQFTRIHRSFIVNRAHVTRVVRKDNATICVLLTNGVEIPVGPNYRAEVDNFEALAHRLSA
jgi:two-component system LytT family response regulator